MDINLLRYLLPLFFILPINGTELGENGTSLEKHVRKSNKRIVRLYSGTRPKPIVCKGEGFQADPTDCTIFHRCMKNGNGKYLSFRFQCGPGTIYDPETEVCNHPERTSRTNCGGNKPIDVPNIEFTHNKDISKEVPSPISTRDPISALSFSFPTLHTTHMSNAWATSSNWQDIKTTKTPPTKRQVKESTAHSTISSWPFTQKITTARSINRQTTSQTGEICTSEGFMGDSENCRKFYSCISNGRGGFIRYQFMCLESTVWDDDAKSCNFSWAVKRTSCGKSRFVHDSKAEATSNPNKSSTQNATPKSIQSQLQINYGSKVSQMQTQISNHSVIQNQTQINYGNGDTKDRTNGPNVLQNQTQISHGSAISQTQTQINYGDKAMQTQLQIDHSKESSQAQSQITESTTTTQSTQNEPHSTTSSNSNNECTKSGFMGDSKDCSKFYRCVDNGRNGFIRYEFSCSEGTVWDSKIEACNHAWAVKECGNKVSFESTTQITTKGSKPTESTTAFTTSTTTVTQGYYSSTEEPIDEDNDIPYGNQPSPIPSKPPHQETTTIKVNQPSNNVCTSSGFMGDNADCKKFYRCVDNGNGGYTRYEFSCGEGTVWDQKIEACNHAWAVKNCGSANSWNASSEQTTSKPITSEIPQYDDNDTGYGSPQHDEPNSSSTTIRTTTKSSTTVSQPTQSQGSNIGNDCTSSGFMGDNNDCKQFYRCVDNGNGGYTKYGFSCGEGTVWDPKIQACNHAWAVEKCGGTSAEDVNKVETTTRKDVESTSLSSSVKPDDSDNDIGYGEQQNEQPTTQHSNHPQEQDSNKCKSSGFMGDKIDCKKFYRCVENEDGTYTRYEFSCGEGTVWDTKIEACNHPWAVEKCGVGGSQPTSIPNQTDENDNSGGSYPIQSDEYVTQSTTLTSLSSSSTTAAPVLNTDNNCKTSGFFGDNMDCKKFYRCVDNGQGGFTRYEFSCGEGTVWDQSIEACNHNWAVKGHCSESDNDLNNDQSTTQISHTVAETKPDDEGNKQPTTEKSTTSHPSTKPSRNQCMQEGFYGDENDCKNFYRCVDNGQSGFTKYEFTCGDGTVWNQDIQACDHESADNKCRKSTLQSTSMKPANDEAPNESTTKESPSASTSGGTDHTSQKPQTSNDKCENEGFYGDTNNCKKFYRCVDDGKGGYTKYDFTCGDGTVWDQDISACNHETSNKKCSGQSGSTSTTMISSQTESSTNAEQSQTTRQPEPSHTESGKDQCETEGFFANSNDCKKFYRCVSNDKGGFTKYDFSCGEGTVWVQEIQACDYDNDISSCSSKGNGSSSPQMTQEMSSTTVSSSTGQYTTQISDKEDDEYSENSSNKPSLENESCTSEGFYANKNDCTRFYRCVDSGQGGYTKYDFTCGEGTAWDSDIQTCNHISEVETCQKANDQGAQSKPNDEETSQSSGNTSTTKSSTSTESSKPSPTDKCNEEGYFGNTKDCTKFYRCVDNGKGGFTKYDFTCGEGTIWDQDLTTCNHPQDVVNPSCNNNDNIQSSSSGQTTTENSGTTSSSSTQSSQGTSESSSESSSNCSQEISSKKPTNQKVKCEKAGFYPDPDDCKKFYRCVDWDGNGEKFSVFHFECGEGTIWDPQLDTCNHEDSVYPPRDCSGSQNQNENVTQENSTTENTTTESSTEESTTTQQTSSSEQTTQSSTEKTTTTTQQPSSEQTTQQSTTEKTTTQQTTSSEKTTQQSTTESTTTQQQTTQESTTSTTQQSTTNEQTTTQQTTTTEQTTTQQSTTSEQTTTQQSTTSEPTTTQQSTTSEQTTTQQSSNTDDTTTEQSTTTTEQSTEQSTTEQTTPENTTEQQATTTESTTTTTTESGESTTSETSSSEKECPETDDDQYLYVCPTSFRRHPKYCNMFYQCTEDDESHEVKIATFKCPNNTIYDESQTQCVEEDKADKKCNGQMARKYRVKRLNADYRQPIEVSRHKQVCNSVGYYPFEKDNECSEAFLKCQRTKSGKLRGYVHRCPEGYTYWSISKRCEKRENMKGCKQSANNFKDRWEIPIERKNIAK